MATPPSQTIPHNSVKVWTKYEYFKRNTITDARASICKALEKMEEENLIIKEKKSINPFKRLFRRDERLPSSSTSKTDDEALAGRKELEGERPVEAPKEQEESSERSLISIINYNQSQVFTNKKQPVDKSKYPIAGVKLCYEKMIMKEYKKGKPFNMGNFFSLLSTHHKKMIIEHEYGTKIKYVRVTHSDYTYSLRLEEQEITENKKDGDFRRNLYWWHEDGCLKWDANGNVKLIKGETFQFAAAKEVVLCLIHSKLHLQELSFNILSSEQDHEFTPDLHLYNAIKQLLDAMGIGRLILVDRLTMQLWIVEGPSPLLIILPYLQHHREGSVEGLNDIVLGKWNEPDIMRPAVQFPPIPAESKSTSDTEMPEDGPSMPIAFKSALRLYILDNTFFPDWNPVTTFWVIIISRADIGDVVKISNALYENNKFSEFKGKVTEYTPKFIVGFGKLTDEDKSKLKKLDDEGWGKYPEITCTAKHHCDNHYVIYNNNRGRFYMTVEIEQSKEKLITGLKVEKDFEFITWSPIIWP